MAEVFATILASKQVLCHSACSGIQARNQFQGRCGGRLDGNYRWRNASG